MAVGHAQRPYLASNHGLVQRLERLLDGRAIVPAVHVVQVDGVHAETAEAIVNAGTNPLGTAHGGVDHRGRTRAVLGGNNPLVTWSKLSKCLAHVLLARAKGVGHGGVKEVDAGSKGLLDDRLGVIRAERPLVQGTLAHLTKAHAAQAETTNLDVRASDGGVLHCDSPLLKTGPEGSTFWSGWLRT